MKSMSAFFNRLRSPPWMLALLAILAFTAGSAPAGSTTFSGSQGSLSASATFTESGTNLIVVLTNTASPGTNMGGNSLLTGVYFDVSGVSTLSRTGGSAFLTSGSSVINATSFTGNPNPGTLNN